MPHCSAALLMNACCTTCKEVLSPSPSIVRTSAPSTSAASCRHDATGRPSTMTVHVPHAPMPQPCLVPVSCKSSRSTSTSKRSPFFSRVSTGSPLSVKEICKAGLSSFELKPVRPAVRDYTAGVYNHASRNAQEIRMTQTSLQSGHDKLDADTPDTVRMSPADAAVLAQGALKRIGYSDDDAQIITDQLIDNALCGYRFASLPRILAIAGDEKTRNARRPVKVVHETPLSALLDGGNNVGYVSV